MRIRGDDSHTGRKMAQRISELAFVKAHRLGYQANWPRFASQQISRKEFDVYEIFLAKILHMLHCYAR